MRARQMTANIHCKTRNHNPQPLQLTKRLARSSSLETFIPDGFAERTGMRAGRLAMHDQFYRCQAAYFIGLRVFLRGILHAYSPQVSRICGFSGPLKCPSASKVPRPCLSVFSPATIGHTVRGRRHSPSLWPLNIGEDMAVCGSLAFKVP